MAIATLGTQLMHRETHKQRDTDKQTDRQIRDPPETTQGSFKVGGGAKGALLVLAVVSLQSLIPPVQLLVPAFLHPTQSSPDWIKRSAQAVLNCSYVKTADATQLLTGNRDAELFRSRITTCVDLLTKLRLDLLVWLQHTLQ